MSAHHQLTVAAVQAGDTPPTVGAGICEHKGELVLSTLPCPPPQMPLPRTLAL